MKTRQILILTLFTALLFFTSCSPRLNVRYAADDTVSMQFISGTGTELTKTFTALTGQQIGKIDTSFTYKALQKAGVTPNIITQDGPDLWLTTGPDKVSGILSGCPGAISVSDSGVGKGKLSFRLSPETAQYIVSLLPEETASYTELFMAPLFTGEDMSADEYTDLIAAVYGQQLANELDSSWFSIYLEVPGTVTSVSVPATLKATSTNNDNLVSLFIPLSSLLTLSDTHSILVFFDKTKYTN